MKDLKLEIKYLPINDIVGYVNNTKKHPQEQIEQIIDDAIFALGNKYNIRRAR